MPLSRRRLAFQAGAAMIAAASLALSARPGGAQRRGAGTGRTVVVTIGAGGFAPADIHVRVGDLVTFVNGDQQPHTVSQHPGGWNSGPIAPGGTWAIKLGQPGAIEYVCQFHSNARGRITAR
jgi:plastocyanin